MIDIEHLLLRLDGVKGAGAGKWKAKCPAHEDSDPSLAIRITQDRLLMHCFAGCSPLDVCHAVGIEMADLFLDSDYEADPMAWAKAKKAVHEKHQLDLDQERTVLALAKSDRLAGKKLSPQDLKREREAYIRLRDAGVTPTQDIMHMETWERYNR